MSKKGKKDLTSKTPREEGENFPPKFPENTERSVRGVRNAHSSAGSI